MIATGIYTKPAAANGNAENYAIPMAAQLPINLESYVDNNVPSSGG